MRYGQIKGIDKPVSRIAQGLMMISTKNQDWTNELLDGVYAQGVNTFDSSHIYGGGDCDRAFGRWAASRGVREKIVMLDKCAHHNDARRRVTPFDITGDLHDCLARLGFTYIDLFVMHRDDPTVPVGPIVEVMNEHIRSGKIRAYGGSNWSHTRIAEANDYARKHNLVPMVASSPHFSLARMVQEPWGECVSIAGPQCKPAQDWYAANPDVALFPWSSLSRGFFSGKYDRAAMLARPQDDQEIAVRCFRCEDNLQRLDRVWELARKKNLSVPQIATAWLMNCPLNIFALIGACSGEEAKQNVAAMDLQLTPQEMAWLDLKD